MPCISNDHDANVPTLSPVLPRVVRENRYQNTTRVKLTAIGVLLGTNFNSAPSYQSKGWTLSIHSEGKRYAHNRTETGLSLVTEAHVFDTTVAESLNDCLNAIRTLATEKDVFLPETSDLFLEFDNDANECKYWFADHANRTVFWLHPVDPITGLPHAFSGSHLRYSLEENYWAHVEMFPATASPYAATALSELQVILFNARADSLTSDAPTFPYTAEEDEKFINLLQLSKEHACNPYVITYVARLWGIVANHRFFTHFGEDHCRLSYEQSILEAPERKSHLLLTAISKALFDIPNGHRARLESLWVDNMTYTSVWRKFVSERIEDLKFYMVLLSALWIANILTLPHTYIAALNKSSMIVCMFGFCVAVILLEEQRKLEGTSASTGAIYLDNHNTIYGFQPTAIVHSIPRGAFVWASFLFVIQGFWMTFGDIPGTILLPIIIPVAFVLLVACFGIWVALYPRGKHFEEASESLPAPSPALPTNQKDVLTADVMV